MATKATASKRKRRLPLLLSPTKLALLSLTLYAYTTHKHTISAKEITATNEWQLLQENDTIPAGLHVRLDLSTGEKWVKLPSSDDEENGEVDIRAAVVEEAVMDASGALTIVPQDDTDENKSNNNQDSSDKEATTTTTKDYKMMHRVMSQLPPEELAPHGGLPALPSSSNSSKLTPEQLQEFEMKMERLWQARQAELKKMQEESVANLPKILEERIKSVRGYFLVGGGGGGLEQLREILEERRSDGEEDDKEDASVSNIIEVLRDLEFQLSDVDMARDFHTLGGWPYLVALLDDTLHDVGSDNDDAKDALVALADEIRALAATTIGTAVSNLEEFRYWALEDVSSTVNELRNVTQGDETTLNEEVTALSLLTRVFQEELEQRTAAMGGGTMAVEGPSYNVAMAKSRATFKLRAIYGLGSLLRGNPTAQQTFILNNGPDVLVRNVLGTLSNVRGPTESSLSRLDYKFASKVLALGEDVVMDVVLHDQEYIQIDESTTQEVKDKYAADGVMTANQLVASFTTEQWCDLSLRMLSPPTEVVGETSSRGIKERALSAVRAMAPSCQVYREVDSDVVWGVEEVKRVRAEWNREGSGDGLDPVYRKELLDLVDGVLDVLDNL